MALIMNRATSPAPPTKPPPTNRPRPPAIPVEQRLLDLVEAGKAS